MGLLARRDRRVRSIATRVLGDGCGTAGNRLHPVAENAFGCIDPWYGQAPGRGNPLEFRLLGPLQVRGEDGAAIDLGGRQQRVLVAVLLLHANEVVSVDHLIEALWTERPPASAVKSLQVQISRLRRALEAGTGEQRLRTHGNGYLLVVRPDELDVDVFRRLYQEGGRRLANGDPKGAERTLSEALERWRGEPLADFAYDDFAQAEIARLAELRLGAHEERFEAELALGRHAALLADAEALVSAHPLRERLRGQLMLALYRSGRQAEALRMYEEARRRLAEELGLEPSEALKRLQRSILDEDPVLDPPKEVIEAGEPRPGAPPTAVTARRGDRRSLVLGGLLLAAAAIVAAVLGLTRDRPSAGLASLNADSLGIIDPATNRLVGEVPVGARPAGNAYAGRALWIANLDDGTVSRVDPDGHRVVRTVTIGTAPAAIAAGAGAVWAVGADGIVRRVDPTFNAVSRRIATIKPTSLLTAASAVPAVAVGYGAVWTATGGYFSRPRVSRVDTATNEIVATFPTGNAPAGIAIGFRAIWVADAFDNTVSRIDPSGVVTATIPVGLVGGGPQAIAVGEGGVWVVDNLDDAVIRIDPTRNAVATRIEVGDGPSAIAVGAHAVWVANSGDGTVSRIDPARNAVVEEIEVGNSPAGIAVAQGSVWVTNQAALPPASAAARGGVARFDVTKDRQTDPALYPDPQISYATCAKLLNYPDTPAPGGTQLVAEVARSLPTLSADGRAYTFTIREGFAFSPPLMEPVTAATFKHAIERALDPRMRGPAGAWVSDIVGASAFASGKAKQIAGVVAHGDKLTITLLRPAPTFPARMAMPLFCAVPLNAPPDPRGVAAIPSAGPYYIAAHVPNRRIVLKRNPNYHGARPHRLAEIVYTIGIAPSESVVRVEKGSADYVAGRVPNEDDARLVARYGPTSAAARRRAQQYFVNPRLALGYLALNTQRPLFSSARMRRAVNYALDRRALARQGSLVDGPGAFTTIPTDQYLPSTMPGFERTSVYPLDGDLRMARKLAGRGRRVAVLYTCSPSPDPLCQPLAQLIRKALHRIGIRVEVRGFPTDVMIERTFKRGEPWDIVILDWGADFVDPSNFLDLLMPVVDERFRSKLEDAARLSGAARSRTYGRLAVELARDSAPWVAYANATSRDFFSARMGCQLFQPVYGMDLATLCTRP
jgi:YVTN family beta-propeller protein